MITDAAPVSLCLAGAGISYDQASLQQLMACALALEHHSVPTRYVSLAEAGCCGTKRSFSAMSAADTASVKCPSTDDGAHPPFEPPAFDAEEEECPAIAVLREEELLLHRRITALAVARGGGLAVDTKSGASSHSDGLLRGIQGLHQRWLFHQQLSEARCVGSAFALPNGRASHDNRGNGCSGFWVGIAPSTTDRRAQYQATTLW